MLYGLVLRIRHLFYDRGWKKTFQPPVPTICVGNLTAGGTGKTPHVELLLRLLSFRSVAVLSRGYKRKTKGFRIVGEADSAQTVGDEPLQIARKFPSVTVAVDKDRIHGCQELRDKQVELVVLDDAFQYRKLEPSLTLLLVDYHRPVFKDRLLPWGRLRDLPSRIRKADAVVVTKSPAEVPDDERAWWRSKLHLREEQPLYFTRIQYQKALPVFPDGDSHYLYSQKVILVSGIANDTPLRQYLSDTYKIVGRLSFPDHHRYTKRDIRAIAAAARNCPTACLMTTEKDAQRLRDVPEVPPELSQRLFYLPIEAVFLSPEEEANFVQHLVKTVNA